MLFPFGGGAGEAVNPVLAPYAKDLVVMRGNQLVPLESQEGLKAPYTVLYFGAGWCPDCRQFSPTLVSAYEHQKPERKRFEVVLLSMDNNAEGMAKFMQTEKMTWPAVAFERLANAAELKKYYTGKGIPCLSVLDGKGSLVLQSKTDQDAAEVLKQLERLLDEAK